MRLPAGWTSNRTGLHINGILKKPRFLFSKHKTNKNCEIFEQDKTVCMMKKYVIFITSIVDICAPVDLTVFSRIVRFGWKGAANERLFFVSGKEILTFAPEFGHIVLFPWTVKMFAA